MWLISARALDKVGPSICVFSASIGRIMHNTGLIVASRITVRAIPVVVIEMNGMPMARNFPFGHQLNSEGELAKHTTRFDFLFSGNTGTQAAVWGIVLTNNPSNTYKDFYPFPYSYTGNDEPHNNIAPLYGVYRFRRLT